MAFFLCKRLVQQVVQVIESITYKEQINVIGNHTFNCSGVVADWRNSKLAAQSKLGLRPQWRAGSGVNCLTHSVIDGATLSALPFGACGKTQVSQRWPISLSPVFYFNFYIA